MESLRFVGLDVHADSISIAVADEDGAPPEFLARIPHDFGKLRAKLGSLGKGNKLRCCYEAGPTGFPLARKLSEAGYECIVVAPSRVPDGKGNRVKTDGRDAIRLARFLRSGDLVPIHVPSRETEAMRDICRAREDAKSAEQRCRQQLGQFMLRHDRKYPGKNQGTKMHLTWLKSQQFEHEAQRRVLADYLDAYEKARERTAKLTADLAELKDRWSLRPVVEALMALRGVDLVTAATVVAEVSDFARFASAPHFASFLGMTPSESSSGERTRRGGITKHGNGHVRRLMTEAAWHYDRSPHLSKAAEARGRNTVAAARQIAHKAQDRLYRRFRRLQARGKERNKIATAVGRELACFIWAIANHPDVKALSQGA